MNLFSSPCVLSAQGSLRRRRSRDDGQNGVSERRVRRDEVAEARLGRGVQRQLLPGLFLGLLGQLFLFLLHGLLDDLLDVFLPLLPIMVST